MQMQKNTLSEFLSRSSEPINKLRETNQVDFRALNQAGILAKQCSRPLDSVFLLATLLNNYNLDNDGSSEIFLAILREKNLNSNASIVELLQLEKYSISWLPSYSEDVTDVYVELDDEIEVLINKGWELAQAHPSREYRSRYLLGTMLSVKNNFKVQEYLVSCGYDLNKLRQGFFDYVRKRGHEKNFPAWRDCLGIVTDSFEAGFHTDRIDKEKLFDKLEIQKEVSSFAAVLAARNTPPPLSVGLFGAWGTGKTFFMNSLEKEIRGLEGKELYYSKIIQITFNAWHYMDANLWASIASHVFEELHEKLKNRDENKERLAELKNKLLEAQGLYTEAEGKLSKVKIQKEEIQSSLTNVLTIQEKKKQEIEEWKNPSWLLQGTIDEIMSQDPNKEKLLKTLKDTTEQLGIKEAAKSLKSLEEKVGNVQTLTQRALAIIVPIVTSPTKFQYIPLFVIILLAPVVIGGLFSYLASIPTNTDPTSVGIYKFSKELFAGIAAFFSNSNTHIAGVTAWLGFNLNKGEKLVKNLETTYKSIETKKKERIAALEADPTLLTLKEELKNLQADEQTKTSEVTKLEEQIAKLESEIGEFSPSKRLYKFIEERVGSKEYEKYLGIVNIVKHDFDKLNELMLEQTPEKDRFVDRIILYIDDLDRCQPSKVVEVLEAVHLLMALPLFIVVVGVDPRWLRRCLQQHYPNTIDKDKEKSSAETTSIRPQDYLEKIFQIPFALRPISITGYENLVDSLLKEPEIIENVGKDNVLETVQKNKVTEVIEKDKITENAEKDNVLETVQKNKVTEAIEKDKIIENAEKDNVLQNIPKVSQLKFTEVEKDYINELYGFFDTPRTVKRFINTYRLLRVGVELKDIDEFETGEYKIALLLLAMVTGFSHSDIIPKFLKLLNNEVTEDLRWEEFLKKAEQNESILNSSDRDKFFNLVRKVSESTKETSLKIYKYWLPKIARYSFSSDLY